MLKPSLAEPKMRGLCFAAALFFPVLCGLLQDDIDVAVGVGGFKFFVRFFVSFRNLQHVYNQPVKLKWEAKQTSARLLDKVVGKATKDFVFCEIE